MNNVSRRAFLKIMSRALVFTGLAAVFAPVVSFFYPTHLEETPAEPVNAGSLEEIPLDQSKTIRFGRYPAIVVHTQQGLRAYSAVCTHFACVVKWDPAKGQLVCPCHDGFFNPHDGSVISGPPPTPLAAIPVTVVENQIFVGGEG